MMSLVQKTWNDEEDADDQKIARQVDETLFHDYHEKMILATVRKRVVNVVVSFIRVG